MKQKIERTLYWMSIIAATGAAVFVPVSYFSDDAKLVIVAVGCAVVTWFIVKVLLIIAKS